MSPNLCDIINARKRKGRKQKMKGQMTIADIEYLERKKTTKREEFLDQMDEIIPWGS